MTDKYRAEILNIVGATSALTDLQFILDEIQLLSRQELEQELSLFQRLYITHRMKLLSERVYEQLLRLKSGLRAAEKQAQMGAFHDLAGIDLIYELRGAAPPFIEYLREVFDALDDALDHNYAANDGYARFDASALDQHLSQSSKETLKRKMYGDYANDLRNLTVCYHQCAQHIISYYNDADKDNNNDAG